MKSPAQIALAALLLVACGDDGTGGPPDDAGMDGTLPDSTVDDGGSTDGDAADAPPPDADVPDARFAACDVDMDLGSAVGLEIATGTTAGGGDDLTPWCTVVPSEAEDLVLAWTAPAGGTYTIDTFGSSFDTVLFVLDAACTALHCADDTAGDEVRSRVDVDVEAGAELRIVVDGSLRAAGDFTLNISQPPAREGECADGVDDDRDGVTDCLDFDCQGTPACIEVICDDGIDNEGDGEPDCFDLDCLFTDACRESSCDDGMDNNDDFRIDCEDPTCIGRLPCSEVDCTDGVDDDSDGALDCADDDCAGREPCNETMCGDGVDGDSDGALDCADDDCACDPACFVPDACPASDLAMMTGDRVARGVLGGAACSAVDLGRCGRAGAPEATFGWTAPATGNYVFDTFGSDYDTVLAVLDTSCTGDLLDCNDDVFTGRFSSQVILSLTAGQSVVVVIEAVASTGSEYALNIHAL